MLLTNTDLNKCIIFILGLSYLDCSIKFNNEYLLVCSYVLLNSI